MYYSNAKRKGSPRQRWPNRKDTDKKVKHQTKTYGNQQTWSYLGNHLVPGEAQALSNLDLNIINIVHANNCSIN